jgi:hypothetical protein
METKGRNAMDYREGGARGEVARGIAAEMRKTTARFSSRFVTGTIATLGDCVTIAEPAAVQKGQMCELVGSDVRSAQ